MTILNEGELRIWAYVVFGGFVLSGIFTVLLNISYIAALRAIFGLVYVLLLPGYFIARFYLKPKDWIEWAALSLGISIAVVILLVMVTNMLFKIPITAFWNFVVLLAFMIFVWLSKKYNKEITRFLKAAVRIK